MSVRYQSRLFQTIQTQLNQWRATVGLRWRGLKHSTVWTAQYFLHTLEQLLYRVDGLRPTLGHRARFQLKQATHRAQKFWVDMGLTTKSNPDRPLLNVLQSIQIKGLPSSDSETSSLLPTQTTTVAIIPLARKIPSLWSRALRVGQTLQQVIIHPPQPQAILQSSFAIAGKTLQHIIQGWGVHTVIPLVREKILQPRGYSLLGGATHSFIAPCHNQLADRSTSLQKTEICLQGVATVLASRHLVLVTTEQQLLDILTPEQQQQLYQRIVWEVATYWRDRKKCGLRSQQLTRPLRALPIPKLKAILHSLPISARLALPAKIRSIQGASRSVNTSYPGSLSQKIFPMAMQSPVQTWGKTWKTTLAGIAGALALLPLNLLGTNPAQATTVPALPLPPASSPLRFEWAVDPTRSRKRWLSWGDVFGGTGGAIQGKVQIPAEKTHTNLKATELQNAIATWSTATTHPTVSSQRDTVDVQAQPMGYVHSLWEKILLALDQGLVWLENSLGKMWQVGWPLFQQFATKTWEVGWPLLKLLSTKAWEIGWSLFKFLVSKGAQVSWLLLTLLVTHIWTALKRDSALEK